MEYSKQKQPIAVAVLNMGDKAVVLLKLSELGKSQNV